MENPLGTWQGKIYSYLFGNQEIIRLEDAKYLMTSESKDKQVNDLKEKISSTTTWNMTFSLVGAMLTVRGFQYFFRSYGKVINVGTILTDLSIFMLWTGSSIVYSLRQLDPDIKVVRKKWILEHDKLYMKQMRGLNRNFDIPLQEQIKPYIPAKEHIQWKMKYDDLLV